jgi:vacuolar-type H+-ATPase subunit F/Vma7
METKVAVIGDVEQWFPFKGAGIEVIQTDPADAPGLVRRLVKEGYGIIFFPEDFLKELSSVLAEVKGSAMPCLIPIPSRPDQRASVSRLKELVRRSVGADIFLKSEK